MLQIQYTDPERSCAYACALSRQIRILYSYHIFRDTDLDMKRSWSTSCEVSESWEQAQTCCSNTHSWYTVCTRFLDEANSEKHDRRCRAIDPYLIITRSGPMISEL
jgi:hypothetical protein